MTMGYSFVCLLLRFFFSFSDDDGLGIEGNEMKD